jgi:hypothetical protein
MPTNKNGQQKGQENRQVFESWIVARNQASDWAEYIQGGQLSRKIMAQECLMGRSAFTQNPEIKKALKVLEDNLRAKGILHPKVAQKNDESLPEHDINHNKRQSDAARLSRLEQENTALRTENTQLKAKLKEYGLLEEIFAETGRVPRPCTI